VSLPVPGQPDLETPQVWLPLAYFGDPLGRAN